MGVVCSSSWHAPGLVRWLGRADGSVRSVIVLFAFVVISGLAVVVAVAAAAAVAVHRDHREHEQDPEPVGGEELDHSDSFREPT
jgi:heme/copper-type cytochrome/quinol oxidase subunit 2